jgi:hypothetical protein
LSALCCVATVAHAATNKVVIGDIDDMSGLYADGDSARSSRRCGRFSLCDDREGLDREKKE